MDRSRTPPAIDPDQHLCALVAEIRACRACEDRFAATVSAHAPNPVLQPGAGARVLIASQAPGIRAHVSSTPFNDPSGERLRAWLGLDRETFYDPRRIAILPMAFCFPGHDAKRGDLPPPPLCAALWRERVLARHPDLDLIVLIGRAALGWHLPELKRRSLTEIVGAWRARLDAPQRPTLFPAPHPSWRNNAWLKAQPWFEADAVPALQARVRAALAAGSGDAPPPCE